MAKETKFGYGFLLLGAGLPYVFDKLLGPLAALIASALCIVFGCVFLLAAHFHRDKNEIRPKRGLMVSIGMFTLVGAASGALIGSLSGAIWNVVRNKPTQSGEGGETPRLSSDLKLEIDRVLPLWGFKHLAINPGTPFRIPPGQPPTSSDTDTYIAVVGKIINDRDIQASAEYWEITVRLSDGRSVNAELQVPPDALLINHQGQPPESISAQDYWPRKLDMRSIPAHGNSYGFIFGVLKGVVPKEFDKPGAAVTLCFRDSSGKRFCDTFARKPDEIGISGTHAANQATTDKTVSADGRPHSKPVQTP
ncbi:MAG: hypothetical protein ACRD51_14665 [Candidatus Acidiferrum sp.]